MSVYFDANVLVALFADDAFTAAADRIVRSVRDVVLVSDFAAAEFSGVIARRVRNRDLKAADARSAFSNFDAWCARDTRRLEIQSSDVAGAISLVRRLDLNVRIPDALHIAIAQRNNATLVTFDKDLAAIARTVDLPVSTE